MRSRPDIIPGTKLNRLTIVERSADLINHQGYKTRMLRVRCDCGQEKAIRSASFYSGHLKSCGCLKVEKFIARTLKHGHAAHGRTTKTYRAGHDAIERCSRPTHGRFPDYGGRGIDVCQRWRESFENFLADMGEPDDRSLSLDRIDNDGNYEPGNCRWATRSQQQRNKRRARQKCE